MFFKFYILQVKISQDDTKLQVYDVYITCIQYIDQNLKNTLTTEPLKMTVQFPHKM